MFELPETQTLARQMNGVLPGKTIEQGLLGNKPHKFVWYNRSHAEFAALTAGKRVGETRVRGRWLFLPLEPGYVLVLGECGGRLLYHAPGQPAPGAYHLRLNFADGSALSLTTQMWGAMELYEQGQELERPYIKDMRPTPVDPQFTLEYFNTMVENLKKGPKRSVKGLLTQEQLIPGLGNSCAQDILFAAHLHPKAPLAQLSPHQCQALYFAIVSTVQAITTAGGRSDEVDFFGQPGGYIRRMDSASLGKPCPNCGASVEKINYLGGACYFCPHCQAI